MRHRFSLPGLAACLLVCLALPGAGEPDPQRAIRAAYEKTCEAAGLKFVDGIVSLRTYDFEAFAPDGGEVDLSFERQRYIQLFESALSVKKTLRILSFRLIDPHRAECTVHEIYEMERLDKGAQREIRYVFESRSRDEWMETPRGWRLKASHISEQRQGPRLD